MSHTVSWEAKTGGDDYSGLTYGDPVEIPALKKQVSRQMAGTGGTENRTIDEIHVLAEHNVQLGDKIDGEIIQARDSKHDHRGRLFGYRLYSEP